MGLGGSGPCRLRRLSRLCRLWETGLPRVLQRRLLPRRHHNGFVGRVGGAVFLEDDGFAGRFADSVVLRDPVVDPGVVVAPLVRVGVEGAVVERGDGEVLAEVDAFVAGVGVGAVAERGGEPAFVAEGDEVVGVEGFYCGREGR